MKRKILIVLMILVMMSMGKVEASGIYNSPDFEGEVIDVVTGKPIENAVVSAVWMGYGKSWMGGSDIFDGHTAITDKNGKYKIPWKININMFSTIHGITVEINHPLYVRKIEQIYEWDQNHDNKISYKGIKQKDGTIRYDIKLVGVEEAMRRNEIAYKNAKNTPPYDTIQVFMKMFDFGSYIGTYSGSFFKDHWDKKFVDEVLKKWEEILRKSGEKYKYDYKNTSFYKDNFKRVKKEVEEAYKGDK